jgi:hypothetical protein
VAAGERRQLHVVKTDNKRRARGSQKWFEFRVPPTLQAHWDVVRIARLVVPTLLVVLIVVAAASSEATPATATSGLYGIVKRGPIRPVCQVEVACDAPAVGVVLMFSRRGTTVARVRTRAGGRYRVGLARGTYTVRTNQRPFGVVPTPSRATVPRGRFARVDFFVDTGIR